MHNFLYFNNPDYADLIISCKEGNLYLMTERVSQALPYFASVDTIKDINGHSIINAKDIFHDENILLDLIAKAHFGEVYKLNVNIDNWMDYILLCDFLLADDEYFDNVLEFLQNFNIDDLDKSFYSYTEKTKVPESIMFKVTTHLLKDYEPSCKNHEYESYCGKCYNHYNQGRLCNNCSKCSNCDVDNIQVPTYTVIPFLVWLHHSEVNLKKVKKFMLEKTNNVYKSGYPQYSKEFSFMLNVGQ